MILELLAFFIGPVYGYVKPEKEKRGELFKKGIVYDSWSEIRDYLAFRGQTVPLCGGCNRNGYRSDNPSDCIHSGYVHWGGVLEVEIKR